MSDAPPQSQRTPQSRQKSGRNGDQGRTKRFWRASLVHVLELAALIIALGIAICGGLVWRLSQGPVPLSFLRADAEAELVKVFDGAEAQIGALQADWSAQQRAVVFAARDVRVLDKNGLVLIQAPRFEIGLSGLGLLQGKPVLRSVVAVGGEFSFKRRMDGAIGLGLGSPDQIRFDKSSAEIAKSAGNRPTMTALLSRVSAFAVRDAKLHFVDERSDINWVAPNAKARFTRKGDQITAQAEGEIKTLAGITSLSINANSKADFTNSTAQINLRNAVPAALLPASDGALRWLSAIDAPLDATVTLATDKDGLLNAADGQILVSEGVYHTGEQQVRIEKAQLILAFDPVTAEVNIQSSTLQSSSFSANIQGSFIGLDPAHLVVGEKVGFDLVFEDVVINPEGVFVQPLAINRFRVDGDYLPSTGHAQLRDFSLSIFDLAFHGTGAITLPDAALEGGAPLLSLQARSEGNISSDEIIAIWPPSVGNGGRDWVAKNVMAGRLHDFVLDLRVSQRAIGQTALEDDMLTLSFAFDEGVSHFVRAMTPVQAAEGHGVLRGNRFDLVLDSGRIFETKLTDGFIEFPKLNSNQVMANFGAHIQGPLDDVVHLLDEEPLAFISRYGLSPETISGQGEMEFVVSRPMRVNVPVREIKFSAQGGYENISVAGLIAGQDLTKSAATFSANQDGMDVVGIGNIGFVQGKFKWDERFFPVNEPRTQLAIDITAQSSFFDELGIPTRLFLDGPVDVHVETRGAGLTLNSATIEADLTQARLTSYGGDWQKLAGVDGKASLDIELSENGDYEVTNIVAVTEGFVLEGDVSVAAAGGLRRAHISQARMADIFDFTADLQRNAQGAFVVSANTQQIDARGFVRGLTSGASVDLGVAVSADITFDRALVSDEMVLKNGKIAFERSAEDFESLMFIADTPNGQTSFNIDPDEQGNRQLKGRADDAGLFIQALFGAASVEGGVLEMDGTLGDGKDQNTKIDITMRDFMLGNVPAFARILSLGSLTGIADTMSGGGLAFRRLYAPLEFENGKMQIGAARATGPALGVTVSGSVDQVEKTMDLNGALAPAYSINSALGNIPVLGKVLVSRKGEGVFGLSFSVQGPFDTLQVFVNPLSAFTPGFLRRMFEGDSRSGLDAGNAADADKPADIPQPGEVSAAPETQPQSALDPEAESESEPEIGGRPND